MNKIHHFSIFSRLNRTLALSTAICGIGLPLIATPLGAQEEKKKFTEEQLIEAARGVDVQIAKIYKRKRVSVPENASDAVFLRRSFLLAVGRIPTLEEARAYLEIKNPNKRVSLVRYLMESKGYDSHMENWLIDLLRVQDSMGRDASSAPYRAWLRKAITENKPYNELTRDLLSAQGSMWDNGAVGYYIRDKGMPLDNMANTMRLFLGTRMECAQCHDHPFDDWERKDFFHLAAFSNGQKEIKSEIGQKLYSDMRAASKERSKEADVVRWLFNDQIYYSTLTNAGTGRIALPEDYQYNDGDPGEYVGAKTPFGKSVRMSDRRDDDDGLDKFATWVTGAENVQFSTIITNRMWKRIIGTGLFEPIDEYVPAEETTSPELTRHLVKLMKELNYDLKAFQHVLMLTQVYAFESSNKPPAIDKKPMFDGRQIERMSAEQYWDSLVTLIAGNPDKLATRSLSDTIYLRGKPVLQGEMTMTQLQKEVLALNSTEELREYVLNFIKKMKNPSSSSKSNRNMMMSGGGGDAYGALKGIYRASELSSPAPDGHILRNFGQSDRQLIGTATKEANPSQVLSMMNGQVEKLVVANKKAHIHKLSQGSMDDRIRSIFMGVLSRLPSDHEMKIMEAEVKNRGEEGYRNIISALINTREFIFIP
ncbi:MAG: DUF1549 domain-containing protein [Akkermansiaceae bacterium]